MDSDKTEKLKSVDTYNKLKNICLTKNKNLINDSIYRDMYTTKDGNRSRVEDKLAISYEYKCAYCERICKADIEHYRPKKKISGESHDGYYWLCYEWSNLIPSCITCNRDGAKHNLFPIIGNRVITYNSLPDGELDLEKFKAFNAPLKDEIPYLLHPEIDDPNVYFEFEIDSNNEGIRIKGIDIHNRGTKTIEICKLNRLELKLDRKISVIDEFVSSCSAVFLKYSDLGKEDKLLDNLEQLILFLKENTSSSSKTHTLLRKYIVKNHENFKKIIGPFVSDSQKKLLMVIAKKTL